MTEYLTVAESGRTWEFGFADMVRFHGGGSPGGVAIAFKVLQRAFGILSPRQPPQRRLIEVQTAFRGPGARDGVEAVTRAVSDHRYHVDRRLVRADLGPLLEDFVFDIAVADLRTTLVLQPGFTTTEFIELARTDNRSALEEHRLDELKAALAQQVMNHPAEQVFALA
ncbi:MAG: hypothetical protein WBB07_27275 [Mycobacterium sp.]